MRNFLNQKASAGTAVIIILLLIIIIGGGYYIWQQAQPEEEKARTEENKEEVKDEEKDETGTDKDKEEDEDDQTMVEKRVENIREKAGEVAKELETEDWETYQNETDNYSLKYPDTLKTACPVEPSCYLGSLGLDKAKYYTADDIPEGEMVIGLGSFGEKDDEVVTDLKNWKENKDGLDEDAEYKEIKVGSHDALQETAADQVTVYVETGTGLVLAFTLFPESSVNEELFMKILETLVIK